MFFREFYFDDLIGKELLNKVIDVYFVQFEIATATFPHEIINSLIYFFPSTTITISPFGDLLV